MKQKLRAALTSRAFLALCALAALVSLAQGLSNANGTWGSGDLQFSAARMLLQGVNAYELYLVDQSQFLLKQGPPYLPLLYFVMLPIGALDWPTARLIGSLINGLLGLFVAFRIYKGFGSARGAPSIGLLAAFAFMASTPFRNTIGNGQNGLLVMTALLLAFESRNSLVSGALLALAATKLSLGAMFVALFGGLRLWQAVAVCGALTVLSFALFGAVTQSPINLRLFLGPILAVKSGFNYPPPLNWLVEVWGSNAAILLIVGTLIGFFGGLLLWRHQPNMAAGNQVPPKLIFAATLLALFSAPHLIYNYVFLGLPFTQGDPFRLLSRWGQVLFSAILAYAGIGQKLVYWYLHFAYDALYAAMWLALAVLVWDCMRNKPVPASA